MAYESWLQSHADSIEHPNYPQKSFVLLVMFIGTCSLAGIVAFVSNGAFSMAPVATVHISSTSLDLGVGDPGAKLPGQISVSNAGGLPLEFTIDSSCGCGRVQPHRGVIAPDENQSITLAVTVPEYAGEKKTVWLHVRSNDPQTPVVECSVRVECSRPPILVAPPSLHFGTLESNGPDTIERRITVTPADGTGSISVDDLMVAHTAPNLDVEKEISAEGQVELVVTLRRDAINTSRFFDSIQVWPIGSLSKVRIPVSARFSQKITLGPKSATLDRDHVYGHSKVFSLADIKNNSSIEHGSLQLLGGPSGLTINSPQGAAHTGVRSQINASTGDFEE